eukprot:TRINITY_DN40931_c0_g1_i1.p1 TRINITY_DN40931_c0_g1~~TRINITY_DN40931_c0_g1_i1.p1  ORF type:complete len:399 (+),score=56.31 TRINITY_DN40931_c0_g1_i1:53-1198(+)
MKVSVYEICLAMLLSLLFTAHLNQASATSNFSSLCEEAVQCTLESGAKNDCPSVPVPPSSVLDNSIAPGSFELKVLRRGVWFYNDGTYNTLLLRVSGHLALIDFPRAALSIIPETPIIAAIQEVLNGTVPSRIDMIYSHAHFDHIGSSRRVFNFLSQQYPRAKIFVWGTLETYDLIKSSSSDQSVLPNIIVGARGRTLRMSRSLKVRMDIVGGHTVQDLRMYIPQSYDEPGIVMYVDVVFPGYAPPFTFALTEDLRRYIQAQKEILKLDFQVLVPGHIGLASKEQISDGIQYAQDVISAARTAIDSVTPDQLQTGGIGLSTDPNAPEFGNFFFPILGVLRPLEIEACFRIVLQKWGCRLGAVDLSARDHCFTAINFLNLDF